MNDSTISKLDSSSLRLWALQARNKAGGVALDNTEEGKEQPADISFWKKQDVPASAKAVQPPRTKQEKLTQTAREFEGMLMTQMFQALRKTVEPSGLFGTNQTERGIYEYLFDQSVFQKAAENGQTWGLAARLEEAWKDHFAAAKM